MPITKDPPKQVQRELARWSNVLNLREKGVSIENLAVMLAVTPSQIYYLLSKARQARTKGWI